MRCIVVCCAQMIHQGDNLTSLITISEVRSDSFYYIQAFIRKYYNNILPNHTIQTPSWPEIQMLGKQVQVSILYTKVSSLYHGPHNNQSYYILLLTFFIARSYSGMFRGKNPGSVVLAWKRQNHIATFTNMKKRWTVWRSFHVIGRHWK